MPVTLLSWRFAKAGTRAYKSARFMSIVVDTPNGNTAAIRVPPSPTVGFKDWSLVCAALGSGKQSLILRKGGIAEGRGLQCAFGRVYRLEPQWTFPDRPGFGGCRSWVTLPEFPTDATALWPVLDDTQFSVLATEVRAAIQP